jgi:hypothetical protein
VGQLEIGGDINYDAPPGEIEWTPQIGSIGKEIAKAIWTWLRELPVGSEVIAGAALTATKEAPQTQSSGFLSEAEEDEVLREAKRCIKEALKRKKDEGRFLKRKPERQDQEWYDAATLLELIRREVSKDLKDKWATRVAELALLHGSTIVERALSEDFHGKLNPVERELTERFFMFNPGLAASARVVRLEITPQSSRKQDLDFPFGFAILARTEGPQRLSGPHKLVYLRVQDHLRRMGLARQALKELLAADNELQIDLKKMHPDAPEVPGDEDRGRLLRLFDSVRTEAQQQRKFRG